MNFISFIFDYLKRKHDICFNSQQKRAIESLNTHILLLAVPGSGKTTVLMARTARLIMKDKISAERILTLTFSRESAKDMKKRFLFLFQDLGISVPGFSTIHSFCYQVLKFYAETYRRPMPGLLGDQGENSKRNLLRQLYLSMQQEFLSDDILESFSNDISLVKNLMLNKNEIERLETSVERFYELYSCYEQVKKQKRLMDFDDLLVYTLDILQKLPAVLNRFQQAYDYIQVDEAQDTSKIQLEIIKLLSEGKNLFMVGDEDQCIYEFRGAFPEGILEFKKSYPEAEVLKIEQNYRSFQEIVNSADQFIRINKNRYQKHMISENSEDQAIFVKELSDYSKQYDALLEEYKNLACENTLAILYRNQESVIPVIDRLWKSGISYHTKESNLKFFTSFIVRDVLSFFTLSYDPCNIDAFERIYYKMMCSKASFFFAKQNIHHYESLLEAAAHAPETSEFMKNKLLLYNSEIKKLALKRPVSALQTIEQKLGYLDYLKKRASSGKNPLNGVLKLNILKIIGWNEANLESYVNHLNDLEQEMKNHVNPKNARLYLSTIHSSKGLEFDTVVLLDAIEGIFPSQEAADRAEQEDKTEIESEARLFYVAVTRAKSRLVIYTSRFCNDEYVVRSRFISYLKPQTVCHITSDASASLSVPKNIEGKELVHRFFGKGVVTDVLGSDMIDVHFEKHGKKTISYSSCMESNIVRFLE